MGRDILLEVLASARALDSSLCDSSVKLRVLEDENGYYHNHPMDPLVAVLLKGMDQNHYNSISKPKKRVYSFKLIESEKLCKECFNTDESVIECLNDWELVGSLKSYHMFSRLSKVKVDDLSLLNEGLDEAKFKSLVESFLVLYGMFIETDIDYNYTPIDGGCTLSIMDGVVKSAMEALDTLHRNLIKNSVVLSFLESGLSANERKDVCVLLDPVLVTNFWSSRPEPDDEVWIKKNFVKNLIAVYCYKAIGSEVATIIPAWVYREIVSVFPEIVLSEAHEVESVAVFETAKKLYDESEGALFSSFDECVRSARMLER